MSVQSIVLPDVYEPENLNKETGTWTKKFINIDKDKIIRWIGSSEIRDLFFIYLLNKYKSNCLLTHVDSHENIIGLEIYTNTPTISDYEENIFENISDSLVDCINRDDVDIIIIPLSAKDYVQQFSHANILIYRKEQNTIEHFEPNGNAMPYSFAHILEQKLMHFISVVSTKAGTEIKFESASKVCPREGLQAIESSIKNTILDNGESESKGYCMAWSMFFTELCLRNPSIPSKVLLESVFKSLKHRIDYRYGLTLDRMYLKQLIRGYVLHISEKIDKYFTILFDKVINETSTSIHKYGETFARISNFFPRNKDNKFTPLKI
jgi:hypothetical protein